MCIWMTGNKTGTLNKPFFPCTICVFSLGGYYYLHSVLLRVMMVKTDDRGCEAKRGKKRRSYMNNKLYCRLWNRTLLVPPLFFFRRPFSPFFLLQSLCQMMAAQSPSNGAENGEGKRGVELRTICLSIHAYVSGLVITHVQVWSRALFLFPYFSQNQLALSRRYWVVQSQYRPPLWRSPQPHRDAAGNHHSPPFLFFIGKQREDRTFFCIVQGLPETKKKKRKRKKKRGGG